MKLTNLIFWPLFILFGIWFSVFVAVYVFQDKLLFHINDRVINGQGPWKIITTKTEDNLTLRHLELEENPDRVILFFHGSGGNAQDRIDSMERVSKANYSIILNEYRQYGGNPGIASEENFKKDADLIYNYAKNKYKEVIVWGESLGTYSAIYLGSKHPVKAVVLDAPFRSVLLVAQKIYWLLPVKYFLKNTFDSEQYYQNISSPIFIMHGKYDYLVPFSHGEYLSKKKENTVTHFPELKVHPLWIGRGNSIETMLETEKRIFDFLSSLN